MRMSMAYFAGAGTVIAAIAAGLGGGLMISDIVSPHATRELSKMELRAKEQSSPPLVAAQSQQAQPPQQQAQSQSNDAQRRDQAAPITASNAPQGPVPYLAQTEQAAVAPVVVTAAPQNPPQPQAEQKPQPQNDTANAASRPVAAVTAGDQASKPDNAYAKAREADLKRPDEKRKAERHQQWTTRRQQREQDSRDAEEQVRDDSEPREIIVRRDDSDRPSLDRPSLDRPSLDRPMTLFPRLNLFGQD